MSGWGHKIARLFSQPIRLAAYKRYDGHEMPERWHPCCFKRKCDEKPEYALTYEYVTGRRGRLSDATRHYCQAHAAEVAERYGIELDEQPKITPQQQRRDMIGQFLK